MKRLLLVLLMGAPAWAVNDFTGDANVVAHYTFTGADPWDDQSGNGNHLYWQFRPLLQTTGEQEGDACCDMESASDHYLYLADADLSGGFPGKNGTSNSTFSVTSWVKLESLPTAGTPDYDLRTIVGKLQTAKYSWACTAGNNGGSTYQRLRIGYSGGSSVEDLDNTGVGLSADTWYHLFWSYNGSTKAYQMQVRTTGGTVYQSSGTATNNMNIEDSLLEIGRTVGDAIAEMDGLLDELTVFNDVISFTDANTIAAGSYDFASDANCVSVWAFNRTGLGWDDKENNHIEGAGVKGYNGPLGDTAPAAAYFNGILGAVWRTDTDLSANFPTKNSGDINDITVCLWYSPTLIQSDNVHPVAKHGNNTEKSWVAGGTASGGVNINGTTLDTIVNQWYHVALSQDDDTWWARVWDQTGTTVYTATAEDDRINYDRPFSVGANTADDELGGSDNEVIGYVSEVVVFNRLLTDADIDLVRQGLYPGSPSTDTMWWWRRRHNN